MDNPTVRTSRIPISLQAVFLAANRGDEVEKPPTDRVASKVFLRRLSLPLSPAKITRKIWRSPSALPPAVSIPDLNTPDQPSNSAATQGRRNRSKKSSKPSISPQAYLDALLHSRGYSKACYKTLDTAYYNGTTPLQEASYDVYLTNLIRCGDLATFADVMQSGISLNPSNVHGESVVHLICRRGDVDFLRCLLNLGCSVQVSDDYGRTPLHDACWTAKPNFDIVEMLLRADRHLLHLMDCRGALPLSYVRKENWTAWLEFFATRNDIFWPRRNHLQASEGPPPLALLLPNSCPRPDPVNALSAELANMVACGKIEPFEVEFLRSCGDDSDDDSDCDPSADFDSQDEDESDTSDENDDSSSCSSDMFVMDLFSDSLLRAAFMRSPSGVEQFGLSLTTKKRILMSCQKAGHNPYI